MIIIASLRLCSVCISQRAELFEAVDFGRQSLDDETLLCTTPAALAMRYVAAEREKHDAAAEERKARTFSDKWTLQKPFVQFANETRCNRTDHFECHVCNLLMKYRY